MSSFAASSSMFNAADTISQANFGEFILDVQPLEFGQDVQQLETQNSTATDDLMTQFSLDNVAEGLPIEDLTWTTDPLDLTLNTQDFNETNELALFPLQQNYSTLFIPPSVTDLSSQLVEYWFRDVCSLWSQYDSPTNSNRMMAMALWSTSEAVSTSLQSMSSAYLSSRMPHMKKTSISMMKNATDVIEAELRVVKSSPTLDTVPMGLIYGLFCIGTSICWLNATQLGIPFLKEAKALLHRVNKQKRRLTDEERKLLNIFNKSWTYCEMLLSVVSDTNRYISYEVDEVEEVDDISLDEFPTAAPVDPVVDDMPHPWTGVSNTVSRLLTQTLRICRNYRYHVKHPGPFATRDHAAALNMIEEAKVLEEKLLGLDFESAPANTETGDHKTPCRHLVNVAEAYRLAGLIHIYQTFPELVLLRLPDNLTGSTEIHIPWEECITPLSLRLAKLIEQLPADSGSKMTQPLLCITASTGLRFESPGASPISLEPQVQTSLAAPSPFDLGSTEHCGLSDYIGQLVQADEDTDRCSTLSESQLKIVNTRRFITGRLDVLETLLPPRPIVVAKTLVQAIWNEYDKEKPGTASVHWIDVMEENNLRSLFG
ncbi:transcription factor [Fusarium longipes]|uniref:Transcription factor n=1 Tax=Fusarium longipes TaxID=694270 RepID=A0A395SL24_9HYPO|nr:transcription factor [Fusarium longipes]